MTETWRYPTTQEERDRALAENAALRQQVAEAQEVARTILYSGADATEKRNAIYEKPLAERIAEVDALKAELVAMRGALFLVLTKGRSENRTNVDCMSNMRFFVVLTMDELQKVEAAYHVLPHARAAHEHVQAMEAFVKLAIAADEASDAYMHEERAMRFGVTDDTKKRHEQAWQEYDEALAALRGEAGKA